MILAQGCASLFSFITVCSSESRLSSWYDNMRTMILRHHDGLWSGSRLPLVVRDANSIQPVEYAVWITMGLVAACVSAMPDWRLGLPGHAIVRSVFPLAMGLALAPRYGGGCLMSGVGLLGAIGLGALRIADTHVGLGALTSLALTGPLLDLALRNAKAGWGLYVRIMSAGVATNLIALGVKLGEKMVVPSGKGKRSLGAWLAQAAWTYPLFGLLAGAVSAIVWFRWRARKDAGARRDEAAR